MTRLKKPKSTSCECGNNKEKSPFVTKIYETRSGNTTEGQQNINLNTLNLRGNIYFKKVTNTLLQVPIRESSKTLNFENDRKIMHKKTTKSFDKNNVEEDTARVLIGEAFNGLLTSQMKRNLLESNIIRSNVNFEEITLSEDCISSDEAVNEKTSEYISNGIENGDHHLDEANEKPNIQVNGFHDIISFEESNDNPDLEDSFDENNVVNFDEENQIPTLNESVTTGEEGEKIKKRRKKRINKVEILLNACVDFPTPSTDKRDRKRPDNFSPELRRKKSRAKSEESLQQQIASNYTISGRLKKKPGRQPKYKGVIYHYLDFCANKANINDNKEDQNNISLDENVTQETIETSFDNTKEILFEEIKEVGTIYDENCDSVLNSNRNSLENLETVPSIISPIQDLKHVKSPLKDAVSIKPPLSPQLTLLRRKEKPPVIIKASKQKRWKKQPVKIKSSIPASSKCKLEFLGDKVTSILGCRTNNNQKEFLVLFENGTSNWIDVEANPINSEILEGFFHHPEQDIHNIHRLISSNIYPKVQSEPEDSSDDDESMTSESDMSTYSSESDYNLIEPYPMQSIDPNLIKTSQPNLTQLLDSKPLDFKPNLSHKLDESFETVNKLPENTVSTLTLNKEYTATNSLIYNSNDLNELCNFVMSSGHVSLYPYEMTKEIVVKKDSEFVHIYLKRFNKKNKFCDDQVNLLTCDKLIQQLEDCAVDCNCEVIVINGIEDYFAVNTIFDKLLKIQDNLEISCPQEISILRYLIQTIRNFNKPIVAVIRKTASGLPASLLSLFDMVFDERLGETTPTITRSKSMDICESPQKENDPVSNAEHQTLQKFLFPRLMGLTESNEAKIMGDLKSPPSYSYEDFFTKNICNGILSSQLRNSVRHMKNNSQIKVRKRSQLSYIDEADICKYNEVNTTANQEVEKIRVTRLQQQLEEEKKLAKQSLTQLELTINSFDTNTC